MTLILTRHNDNAACRVLDLDDEYVPSDVRDIVHILSQKPFPRTTRDVQKQVNDLKNSVWIDQIIQWKFCRIMTANTYSLDFVHKQRRRPFCLLMFSSGAPLEEMVRTSWD